MITKFSGMGRWCSAGARFVRARAPLYRESNLDVSPCERLKSTGVKTGRRKVDNIDVKKKNSDFSKD